MNVLVLNCGSSSLKFRVMALDRAPAGAAHGETPGRALAGGLIERIGGPAALTFQAEGRPSLRETAPVPGHDAAVARVIAWLRGTGTGGPAPIVTSLDAVGHRVVHGGAQFVQPVLVDDRVLAAIEALEALAPLHNGPSLAGIRAARAAVGHLARVEAVPVATVEQWLNERSGLLGLSGRSRDMRDLLEHEREDPGARLAVEVFCYRARKYVGAYLAALGGAEAVVFSGGIG